jgi:hypothetical protein
MCRFMDTKTVRGCFVEYVSQKKVAQQKSNNFINTKTFFSLWFELLKSGFNVQKLAINIL